jgi:uncharacterized membrane protein
LDGTFDKLIATFVYGFCVLALVSVLIVAGAAVRAYQNSQIPRERLIRTLLFLLACFGIPVLILLVFYPRPAP